MSVASGGHAAHQEDGVVTDGTAQLSGKAIYNQRKMYGKTSALLGEISQYNVEHLITFAVERKDGLLTVDDAVRKLKLLDARGKVWCQEALMQVDEKAVKLFDQNTQEELEHFILSSIQHSQVVLDADPYRMVALVVKDADQKNPDIHLFNSPVVPADVIVSDIDSALADCKDKKGKKVRPETLRRVRERVEASVIPPPPLNPPPAPPMKDIGVRERAAAWGNIGPASEVSSPPLTNGKADSIEMSAVKINRDVQLLNHTLDDIEDFISKLQKSAEAMKELSARKAKKGHKGKKKMAGDGMLTLRSRLPLEPKFLECFRKFKFAFNLLAKLKTHIQNPNAVEIVHFLFAPLEMCVRACGGYDIPRSVESPLLTKDAIELLTNCTTTHEAEQWNNLGDYWTKSRAEFPKGHYFPPYVPQFNSGWEPPPLHRPSADGEDHTQELAATIAEQANRVSKAEEARRMSDVVADMNATAYRHAEQDQATKSPAARNLPPVGAVQSAKLCRSMYDFVGRNKNELNVSRDEMLEVLQDDKAWWRVQNKQGDVGYVPGNHMVLITSGKSPPSSNPDSPISTVPLSPPPLSPVSANVPPQPLYAVVHAIPSPPPVPVQPTFTEKEQIMLPNGNSNDVKVVAEVGPKPLTTKPSSDRLQEELRMRVNTQKVQQRNFSIPKKSPSSDMLRLTNNSTQDEVKRWLRSRAFSQITVDSLGVLNGAQLFTLTKEELKMVCEDEGAKVFSQLQVQKSMMADSSGDNELSLIMKRRQQMSEGIQ